MNKTKDLITRHIETKAAHSTLIPEIIVQKKVYHIEKETKQTTL